MMRKLMAVIALVALAGGCYPEDWAEATPDGKAIIVSNPDKGVAWIPLDGKPGKKLADHGWNPKVSPDGRFCVFTQFDETDHMTSEDFVLYDLTTDTKTVLRSLPCEKDRQESLVLPAWKPDGKEVAYVLMRLVNTRGKSDDKQPDIFTELHIMNPLAREDRQVAASVGMYCAWSPDGKRLAFTRVERGGPALPEELTLGALRVLNEGRSEEAVAGILFNWSEPAVWLSNDRILFGTLLVQLPVSSMQEENLVEAACVADLTTATVGIVDDTRGMSWTNSSSCLVLSPNCRRLLYAVKTGQGLELRCDDFAHPGKGVLAKIGDNGYPFWVTETEVGYYENRDAIVIATLDENGQAKTRRTIDLKAQFEALNAKSH